MLLKMGYSIRWDMTWNMRYSEQPKSEICIKFISEDEMLEGPVLKKKTSIDDNKLKASTKLYLNCNKFRKVTTPSYSYRL